MADADQFITVVTYDDPSLSDDENSKGVLRDAITRTSRISTQAIRHVEVRMDTLEVQMARLLKQVGTVLSNAKQQAGEVAGMELDEVEISVEINGQGQVSLMGIGGQAGASGAMILRFKRKP